MVDVQHLPTHVQTNVVHVKQRCGCEGQLAQPAGTERKKRTHREQDEIKKQGEKHARYAIVVVLVKVPIQLEGVTDGCLII